MNMVVSPIMRGGGAPSPCLRLPLLCSWGEGRRRGLLWRTRRVRHALLFPKRRRRRRPPPLSIRIGIRIRFTFVWMCFFESGTPRLSCPIWNAIVHWYRPYDEKWCGGIVTRWRFAFLPLSCRKCFLWMTFGRRGNVAVVCVCGVVPRWFWGPRSGVVVRLVW